MQMEMDVGLSLLPFENLSVFHQPIQSESNCFQNTRYFVNNSLVVTQQPSQSGLLSNAMTKLLAPNEIHFTLQFVVQSNMNGSVSAKPENGISLLLQ